MSKSGDIVGVYTDASNPRQRRVITAGHLVPLSLSKISAKTIEQSSPRAGETNKMAEGYIEFEGGLRKGYTVVESSHKVSKERDKFLDEAAKHYNVSRDFAEAMYAMGAMREPRNKRMTMTINMVYVNIEVEPNSTFVLTMMMTDWQYVRELAAAYVGARWLDIPVEDGLPEQMYADLWYLLCEVDTIEEQLNALYANEDNYRSMENIQHQMADSLGSMMNKKIEVDEAWHVAEHWPATDFARLYALREYTPNLSQVVPILRDPANNLIKKWSIADFDVDFMMLVDNDALAADLTKTDPDCSLLALLTPSTKGTAVNLIGGAPLSACYAIARTFVTYTRLVNGSDVLSLTNEETANIMGNLPSLVEVAS